MYQLLEDFETAQGLWHEAAHFPGRMNLGEFLHLRKAMFSCKGGNDILRLLRPDASIIHVSVNSKITAGNDRRLERSAIGRQAFADHDLSIFAAVQIENAHFRAAPGFVEMRVVRTLGIGPVLLLLEAKSFLPLFRFRHEFSPG